MGMSLETFEGLTPEEFEKAYHSWCYLRDADYKERWEHTRFTGYLIIKPYSKKQMTLRQFLTFSWEKKNKVKRKKDVSRLEKLKTKYGNKISL